MEISNIDALIEILKRRKQKGSNEYHFRPYCIDGVYCYIVLYLKFSILTIESVNIKCKFLESGTIFNQPYVMYHHKYKSFKQALELITNITTKYKILNGDLESPDNYKELQIETCVLPYKDNEKCSVCFENTTDTTVCGHSICFQCREKCILNKQLNCPICRNENIIHIYNNPMQLFNNRDSSELHRIFVTNHYKFSYLTEPEPDDSSSEEEEESSSEEDEDSSEEDEDSSEEDEDVIEEPLPPPVNEFINDYVI